MGEMPLECNGLALRNENEDFSKWNCMWVQKPKGRPIIKKEKQPKKRSKINNPQSICLVMEKDHLDFIKKQALQLSVQQGTYIEPNELIREALQKAFPTPKQFDMFGDKK